MKQIIRTSVLFLLCAAPAVGQEACDGWGTRQFFLRATAEQVTHCLEAGADVHALGDLDWHWEPAATPLYWAAAVNPDPRVMELLAHAGADVNAPSESGRTPLHIATLRNPVVFPRLLELGADPETLDREGRTPMDYAAENPWLQGMEEVRRLMRAKENESRQGDAR